MITPAPITAFLGINGSGKSLSAIAYALRDQRRNGRPILTNMVGLTAEHYHVETVDELPALMDRLGREYRSEKTGKPIGMNIVLDEAGAMFSSREAGQNRAFQRACQQLRKYRARLLWTAPTFGRAEKILREVTLRAVLCTPIVQTYPDGDPWPSTRWILQKKFDVSRLDTSGTSINQNAKVRGFGWVMTRKWQNEFDSFASAGLVLDPDVVEALVRKSYRPALVPVAGTDLDGRPTRPGKRALGNPIAEH